ncbi:MAG TPA: hypothetical protein VM939_01955 [Gemmatimonadaceae bacterium]|nr:hypothetical protein [Gemmatimonadaceae bacterium]
MALVDPSSSASPSVVHADKAPPKVDKIDRDEWSIHESLLQSYRSIYISSQSFLLAVGAIVSGRDMKLEIGLALIGLMMIWLIWFPTVRARHRIVDYYKFLPSLTDAQRASACSEGDYVHDADKRRRTNEMFQINTNWRITRRKLDFFMPFMFSAVWFLLLMSSIPG